MLTIRLSKTEWAKPWRAMIKITPVRLVRHDPAYEVLPVHLEAMTATGFADEVSPSRPPRTEKRREDTSR